VAKITDTTASARFCKQQQQQQQQDGCRSGSSGSNSRDSSSGLSESCLWRHTRLPAPTMPCPRCCSQRQSMATHKNRLQNSDILHPPLMHSSDISHRNGVCQEVCTAVPAKRCAQHANKHGHDMLPPAYFACIPPSV
jgi:hypothetical protein